MFFIAVESSTMKNPDCGCQLLTFNDYTDMMWTTLAEFPGTCYISGNIQVNFMIVKLAEKICFRVIWPQCDCFHEHFFHFGNILFFSFLAAIIVTMFCIERLGRKKTMAIQFLLTALCYFLLFICSGR